MRIALMVILITFATMVAAAWGLSQRQARAEQDEAVSDLKITVSEKERSTLTGDVFSFTSEIRNEGPERTPPLIANLAFVATDGSTYVDPEDWSGSRTKAVAPIAPRSSVEITWTVKTVLEGDVAAYVTVLPAPPELSPESPLAISPAIQMHVEEDRKLNPGGVLPTVLTVPAVLAAAFAGLRVMRRLT
jgi:hypothetical protein